MVNAQTTRGKRGGARGFLRSYVAERIDGDRSPVIPGETRFELHAGPQTIAPRTFHPGAIELSAMHARRLSCLRAICYAGPTRIREFVIARHFPREILPRPLPRLPSAFQMDGRLLIGVHS